MEKQLHTIWLRYNVVTDIKVVHRDHHHLSLQNASVDINVSKHDTTFR